MTSKAKIRSIKTDFRGLQLPKEHTDRGRAFEKVLENLGNPVAVGRGADYPEHNLEVKTKDKSSRSANSVGSMLVDDIINTPYRSSTIADKLQQQFRVTTDNGIVIANNIYDFSHLHIQEKLERAYEACREKMKSGCRDSYIRGSEYGYFEKKVNSENSWAFRISVNSMKKLESMARAAEQLNKLIEVI